MTFGFIDKKEIDLLEKIFYYAKRPNHLFTFYINF